VVDEQADVLELHVAPRRVGERVDVEARAEQLDALEDALVVEADPLLHRLLQLGPGAAVEELGRACARRPEEPVVLVEALDEDGGDLGRGARRDSLLLGRIHEHTVGEK
jgi:hypothetical protein